MAATVSFKVGRMRVEFRPSSLVKTSYIKHVFILIRLSHHMDVKMSGRNRLINFPLLTGSNVLSVKI